MKRLIVDLDGTISFGVSGEYEKAKPNTELISRLRDYKELGFEIVIMTARNMRTYEGNLGKINKYTLPVVLDWLDKHNVPYDEVIVGKPWCGKDGFYIDDRAVRPGEFVSLDCTAIQALFEEG